MNMIWTNIYFFFLQCYELEVTILLSLILNFILDESLLINHWKKSGISFHRIR